MEVRVPSLLALFFFFKVPTFPHPSSFGTTPEVPVSVLVPGGLAGFSRCTGVPLPRRRGFLSVLFIRTKELSIQGN